MIFGMVLKIMKASPGFCAPIAADSMKPLLGAMGWIDGGLEYISERRNWLVFYNRRLPMSSRWYEIATDSMFLGNQPNFMYSTCHCNKIFGSDSCSAYAGERLR